MGSKPWIKTGGFQDLNWKWWVSRLDLNWGGSHDLNWDWWVLRLYSKLVESGQCIYVPHATYRCWPCLIYRKIWMTLHNSFGTGSTRLKWLRKSFDNMFQSEWNDGYMRKESRELDMGCWKVFGKEGYSYRRRWGDWDVHFDWMTWFLGWLLCIKCIDFIQGNKNFNEN